MRYKRIAIVTGVIAFMGLLLCPVSIRAQVLSGRISDQRNGQPLEGATIAVTDEQSHLFLAHALSDRHGAWSITRVPIHTPLRVIVSYSGYIDSSAVFALKDSAAVLQTGEWKMRPMTKELEKVIVSHKRPPFVINKDTIEFDAKQFKTLPNDMVQDLLRKLPGIQVDAQGNVTVNGKPVDKIKVDGRDFFTGNMKAVTETLPGNIIDKVQVTDTREKGEENTTIVKADKQRVTLNLTLKKENKRGAFGDIRAAAGNDHLHEADAVLHVFDGDHRFSILGAVSNVSGVSGGMSSSDRSGLVLSEPGISKPGWGMAANFNDKIGKNVLINGSYDLGDNTRLVEESTQQQNFLPDSSFLFNSRSISTSRTQSQHLYGGITVDLDTLQHLSIEPAMKYIRTDQMTDQLSASISSAGKPINGQNAHMQEHGNNFSFDDKLQYSRNSKDGRSHLTIDWATNIEQRSGKRLTHNKDVFYTAGDSTMNDFNQSSGTSVRNYNSTMELTFKHDFSSKLVGLFKYSNVLSAEYNKQDVYDYDPATGLYDLPDSTYTSHYRNSAMSHIPEISIGYTGKKLMVSTGLGLNYQDRENHTLLKDSSIRVRQRNLTPDLLARYEWSKYFHQVFSWSAISTPPTPEELAPVRDNKNPLVVKTGNPALRAEVQQRFVFFLEYYKPDRQLSVDVHATYSMVQHKIVEDTYYDTVGRQVTSYLNVEGSHGGDYAVFIMKGYDISNCKLRLYVTGRLHEEVNAAMVNQQQNIGHNVVWNISTGPSVDYKEVLSVNTSMEMELNRTTYSLAGILPQSYHTVSGGGTIVLRPVKRLSIRSHVSYRYNSQLPATLSRNLTLWNEGVEYAMLHEQRLTVGFSVNNILNSNNNVRRSVTPTAISTSATNMLQRYCMLSMKYRLSKFGEGER